MQNQQRQLKHELLSNRILKSWSTRYCHYLFSRCHEINSEQALDGRKIDSVSQQKKPKQQFISNL